MDLAKWAADTSFITPPLLPPTPVASCISRPTIPRTLSRQMSSDKARRARSSLTMSSLEDPPLSNALESMALKVEEEEDEELPPPPSTSHCSHEHAANDG